jgi:uncharacterized membrane protein YbhN (UPF0104 family)
MPDALPFRSVVRFAVGNRTLVYGSLAATLALAYFGGVAADPLVLLVAYGVATAIATIPLTPGGIGVFETTMLATLALLGVSSEAAIPILGYRLFNFWLPIPLAAVFYPTLQLGGEKKGSP